MEECGVWELGAEQVSAAEAWGGWDWGDDALGWLPRKRYGFRSRG